VLERWQKAVEGVEEYRRSGTGRGKVRVESAAVKGGLGSGQEGRERAGGEGVEEQAEKVEKSGQRRWRRAGGEGVGKWPDQPVTT
jgi:hypothetical protein